MVFSVPCTKNTWMDSKFNLSMLKHAHRNSDNESTFLSHHYRPQRSWGKVMFLSVSVILFTGGGSAPLYAGMHPPCWTKGRHPPLGVATPWEQTPPKSRHPLEPGPPWSRPQTPPRADPSQTRQPPPPSRPPPSAVHPGRYGQQAGGTHPTAMQSRLYVHLH